ncbi:MAG: hypothetical protein M1840_005814 [Geoglossum simile]|nr:MAG: hypothetical protein M1840_005814 [Geoglossum simile]
MSTSLIATSHHHSGPLSPLTPSPDLSQLRRKQSPPLKTLPQTPTSPQLMSASSQHHASPSSTTYISSAAAASQLSATPPSSIATSTQQSQQPAMNSFPTPASSIAGTVPSNPQPNGNEDGDSDVRMQFDVDEFDVKPLLKEDGEIDLMDIDIEKHRRTDHDRQGGSTTASKPGTEWLHADMGAPYLICDIRKVPYSRTLKPHAFHLLQQLIG